jgi:hypothetical protein
MSSAIITVAVIIVAVNAFGIGRSDLRPAEFILALFFPEG